MKKWMLYAIGLIVILGLAGGFFIHYTANASTYKTSMQNGRTEIKNKQYNAAQTNFQKAAKIKPNSMEANNLLSQTSKFVDGENKFKDYDFNGASESFNDVVNYNQGSSILKDRANLELKILKQVSKNVTRLEKIYNQALEQNKAKEFDDSNDTLDGIFDDDLASNTFYAGIVKEAKKLKSANDDKVVLSKYKAKKTSTDTTSDKNAKPKKTKKITKATKETSTAIDEITSAVAPTVAYDSSTPVTSEDNSTASSQPASNPAPATSDSSSTKSSTSSNSTGNSQPATPASPAEHHDSPSNGSSSNSNNSSNNNSNSTNSAPKADSNSSQSTNNPAAAQSSSTNNGTPTN